MIGGILVGAIAEALSDLENDGLCHCLNVRSERTATNGICDTCGRMVYPYETNPTKSVTILTEVKR